MLDGAKTRIFQETTLFETYCFVFLGKIYFFARITILKLITKLYSFNIVALGTRRRTLNTVRNFGFKLRGFLLSYRPDINQIYRFINKSFWIKL